MPGVSYIVKTINRLIIIEGLLNQKGLIQSKFIIG